MQPEVEEDAQYSVEADLWSVFPQIKHWETKSERHRWDLMSNSPCCYLKGMAEYSLGELPIMSHLCMGESFFAC